MNIAIFTAGLFTFSEAHVARILSEGPDSSATVAQSEEHLLRLLPDAEILICGNYNFRSEWLRNAPRLKWIHSIAAGNEKILPALSGTSVLMTDSSGVHSVPISEQVLGCMLMLERQLLQSVHNQLQRKWQKDHSTVPGELQGKTVLIVGFGAIGRETARLCSCLGMNVFATKRTAASELPAGVSRVLPMDKLSELIPKADYVVLSLPSTKDTYRMFGKKEIALMKPTAFIINIARGSVIDEQALIEALRSGRIAGAALDVFETEPLPESSPLWAMPNVIITPHNAGLTPHYIDRVTGIFCSNLRAYLGSRPMPTLVDREKGY